MKQRLLEQLKKEYGTVHGCYRPVDGPCFYIASQKVAGDYGRRQGRRFVAAVEGRDGTLTSIVFLTFQVTSIAQQAKHHLIGNFDEFCQEVGFDRLREALDRDSRTERDEEILLTKDDDESRFQKPSSAKAIRRYSTLKNEIIHFLAGRHAQAQKRVLPSVVVEGLCDDPRIINKALNELGELELIRDLNHSGGMRLTAEGQRLAETSLERQTLAIAPRSLGNPMSFDFFISYASEDRSLAVALEQSLAERGHRVWRDQGQLTLGDSLTAKINQGLAASRYAIVILSKSFLRKKWPQAELDALQARAINTGRKVILPIRYDLTHEELMDVLPLLGDKLTILFDGNIEEIIGEIERASGQQ